MMSTSVTCIKRKLVFVFSIYILKGCTALREQNASPKIISVPMNNSDTLDQVKSLPKVGKCCPVGYIMTKDEFGNATCRRSNLTDFESFSPYFSDFNRTGVLIPGNQKDTFVAIIGDPCRDGRYILEPEVSSNDDNYLLHNGSVFGPNQMLPMLSPGTDYCMEIIPGRGLRTLVCFRKEDQHETSDFRLTFYACGLLISVPFLVLTIIAYCITPRLMDAHGKALCHYCGCLAVAFTALAIVQLASIHLSNEFCVSIAFIIQFSFVACFFWLNVMCMETYLLVHRYMQTGNSAPTKPNELFFYYSLWAWTPPALLIIVAMVIDISPIVPTSFLKPKFGTQSCWFKSDAEAMPYFYVPVSLVVISNIVLFVMTAVAITRHQQELDLRRLREDRESHRNDRRSLSRFKRLFIVCLGLFFLMGMNWAMEVISWLADGSLLVWSAFDLVNALQGIIVFGIFVLRKRIRQLVWYEIQKIRGVDCEQPDSSVDRSLFTVLNVDTIASERIP